MSMKSKIIAASKSALRPVCEKVDGYGEPLYFRRLSAAETDEFGLSVLTDEGKPSVSKMKNQRARLVALSLCDENGKPEFTFSEAADLANSVLRPLYEAAARINGIGEQAAEDAGNDLLTPAG